MKRRKRNRKRKRNRSRSSRRSNKRRIKGVYNVHLGEKNMFCG